MKRVLSGIQPSGQLHLGNYFGMMQRMIRYQEENDLFCCIVNYHALTTVHDAGVLSENTLQAAIDFIALGMDSEKSTFWIQGDVPEVTELTWLISNVTGVGLMERGTSYKDKLARGLTPNMGLFNYPILMASDILLFGGELVPVGKDQKQHLEMTRDIAQKFNQTFGDVFIIPEPDIAEELQMVPGTDGQKMSKSYDNIIPIFDDEKAIKKKIMSMVTDSTPVEEPKDFSTPIFQLFSLFLNEAGQEDLKLKAEEPGLGFGDVKSSLYDTVMDHFADARSKREDLMHHKDDVKDMLKSGAKKARSVASEYLEKARKATGISYGS